MLSHFLAKNRKIKALAGKKAMGLERVIKTT
jgi:hypothetical protein